MKQQEAAAVAVPQTPVAHVAPEVTMKPLAEEVSRLHDVLENGQRKTGETVELWAKSSEAAKWANKSSSNALKLYVGIVAQLEWDGYAHL